VCRVVTVVIELKDHVDEAQGKNEEVKVYSKGGVLHVEKNGL